MFPEGPVLPQPQPSPAGTNDDVPPQMLPEGSIIGWTD
jgi:hypothetical protein